ncbi:MAG: ArsR/SmtB family transcription factor [Pseudooceanicola sp.]
MKDGPDIARIASLIGDPARANMLGALMGGQALTARELAEEAGVTPQTASGHLARLREAGLLALRAQGRHRYYRLAGEEVAAALEGLMVLAGGPGPGACGRRTRPGPRDADLRRARSCYRHLAGEMGVRAHDSLLARGMLTAVPGGLALTAEGRDALAGAEIGAALPGGGRAVCRECLDWSERRMHLAGPLGTAILDHVLSTGWARRAAQGRAIRFTPRGAAAFEALFPLEEPRRVVAWRQAVSSRDA